LRPCHSNKPGENKFGPSLAGIFGRKSGTEPGYNFVGIKGAERHLGWNDPGRISRSIIHDVRFLAIPGQDRRVLGIWLIL
jgi:hypothetical protein